MSEQMMPVRPELPPMPSRVARLPVDRRGYPVPWFVQWLDEHDEGCRRGHGRPDFRIMDRSALEGAMREGRCWVCGQVNFDTAKAFVVGPMCAVNRTSAEPPSHIDCADWSARACPFLTRPHARRRDAGLPEGGLVEAAGIMLKRNPGVALVWVTRAPSAFHDPSGGVLFDIGDPKEVRWYAEGRPATRSEVMASIESGAPLLRDACEGEDDLAALDACLGRAMGLVPA